MVKINYHGLEGPGIAWKLSELLPKDKPTLVILSDEKKAQSLIEDLHFFGTEIPIFSLPSFDTLPFEPNSPDLDISARRNFVLRNLLSKTPGVYITSIVTLLRKYMPLEIYTKSAFTLNLESSITISELHEKIKELGYLSISNVETVGEYAVRGGVIDVFPPEASLPIRIEVLGNSIQSIRSFDPTTQRSLNETQHSSTAHPEVTLDLVRGRMFWNEILSHCPFAERELKERCQDFLKAREVPPSESSEIIKALEEDFSLPGIEMYQHIYPLPWLTLYSQGIQNIIVDRLECTHELDEYRNLITERESRLTEQHYCNPPHDNIFNDNHELFSTLLENSLGQINRVELLEDNSQSQKVVSYSLAELSTQMKQGDRTGHPFKPLGRLLESWRREGRYVAFVVGSAQRAKRLQRILLELEIDTTIREDISGREWLEDFKRYPVVILRGRLSAGIHLPDEEVVFVSEREVFGEQSIQKSEQAVTVKRLLNSLSQLSPGDLVVHIDYGIGRYHGFSHREVNGNGTDLLQIEYADSMLFLPMTNIGKVERFTALEGQTPTLDKLSSQRWQKTKAKVRRSVETLAGDLVKLYAARSVSKGWRYDSSGAEDERFADGFPFQETADQLEAIEKTLNDMASEKPMDRLICGDVGFGKTEIAMRAAYKANQHAKQVAILAPTTILVEQHRQSFEKRLAEFPVNVGAVSRFYSPKKNKETLQKLQTGEIDIIIGTHKLLQRDVEFKDLGLLIIDEEHRFGVKQKERLKQIKKQIDVLTLTATPIPRTLHMSLLHLRDISIISTPPVDRRTVRTFVTPEDENVIRDAILRELKRQGQIFFVHNRVQSIELIASQIREIVPEARITFAHGQMSETQLEKIMNEFLNHEIDVLVCTTIIESGIDIPNANTILIDRSDTFGLAQLYQLRGRVGRSNRQAYCYFLIPKKKRLTGDAQERLRALQSLDELGVGFQLAVRDLEIRGAGNLLGKEQSGMVLAVGFDLYTRILNEAIHHLTGEELELSDVVDPEVKIDINAYIPETYIPDVRERMVLYQRLSSLTTVESGLELYDEMIDRFGPLGEETENLLNLMQFRAQLKRYGIEKCDCNASRVILKFAPKAKIDSEKILEFIKDAPKKYKLGANNSLTLLGDEYTTSNPESIYREVLSFLDKIV